LSPQLVPELIEAGTSGRKEKKVMIIYNKITKGTSKIERLKEKRWKMLNRLNGGVMVICSYLLA